MNASAKHTAKTPSTKAGLLATLRALLHRVKGSGAPLAGTPHGRGAPSRRTRLTAAAGCLAVAIGLLFGALAPAAAQALNFHHGVQIVSGQGRNSGLAVDQSTGDLYLSNFLFEGLAEGDIAKFDSAGSPGSPATFSPGYNEGVAVNPTNSDVYVLSGGGETVSTFDSETGTEVGSPFLISIGHSNLATDAQGNLYVPTGEGAVNKYAPSGAPATPSSFPCTACTHSQRVTSVAVDRSTGDVYIASTGGGDPGLPAGSVVRYDASGNNPVTICSLCDSTSVAVDSANHHVFVATQGNRDHPLGIIPYDSQGNQIGPEFGQGLFENQNGFQLGVDEATGVLYASYSTSSPPGSIYEFTPIPPPSATTGSASAVNQTTASLEATVNPNGVETEECTFEWGPEKGVYTTGSTPCTPPPGSASSNTAVEASLTHLKPATEYHYRVVETTEGGTAEGEDATFTTLPEAPTITVGAASAITQTEATISATVNPNGGGIWPLSACNFEWGPTSSYTAKVPCPAPAGKGGAPVAEKVALGGLTPATTYHFRLVASNEGGTQAGSDQTFTTLANTCATDPALCPPPIEPSNKITIGAAKQKGAAISLKVTVPGAGSLAASGKDLKAAAANPTTATTLILKLSLSAPGLKLLKKKHRLAVKVTFTFTPKAGKPGTAVKTITFKAKAKRKYGRG